MNLQIKTPAQLEAAFAFFASTGPEDFKLNEFEEACGVGKHFCLCDYEHVLYFLLLSANVCRVSVFLY